MSSTALFPRAATPQAEAPPSLSLADLEQRLARSTTFAWCVIAGLPALGFLASVVVGLPLFASLMAACFLLGTGLVCHKAVATFTGRTLRLLVAARLVLVGVVGCLLFLASGSAWSGVVSTVLLWLAADRLLGRRALHDLWKLTRKDAPNP